MPPRLLNRETSDALLGLGEYIIKSDGEILKKEELPSKITHVFIPREAKEGDARCFAFASGSTSMGGCILDSLFVSLDGPGSIERRRRMRRVAFYYVLHQGLWRDVELSAKAKEEWEEGVTHVFGYKLRAAQVGDWEEFRIEDLSSYGGGGVVKAEIHDMQEWYDEIWG